jgi:HlyD family secretion protein
MQVLADIDEADVGQLSPASKVTFTVDAFPQETFTGRISQIRLSPRWCRT